MLPRIFDVTEAPEVLLTVFGNDCRHFTAVLFVPAVTLKGINK